MKIIFAMIFGLGFLAALVGGIIMFSHPVYVYQGVTDMSQTQYTNFMQQYGFTQNQSNFATGFNQATDKLIVTYNFESASTDLSIYNINNYKEIDYRNPALLSLCSSLCLIMCIRFICVKE